MSWALLAMLVMLAAGCGAGSGGRPASERPALKTLALPDVSNAAESVQRQLRERFEAVQAAVNRAGASQADMAAAYGDMGRYFMAAEYYDAAEASFANARALAPTEMRWAYLGGHVARRQNNPAVVIGRFEDALTLSPDHVPSLVWLAEMHLALSRPDAAEPLLTRARALDPANSAVLFALGRTALERRDHGQAVAYLEDALASAPQATRIHYPLALAYRGAGNRAKAEEHLRLRGEVDLTPADPILGEVTGLLTNAAAYETRGSQAIDARNWPEAAAHLRKAVELAPGNAFTRLNLGTALYMQGDAGGALEQYRAATGLSPGLARAHYGIGVIAGERGDDRAAIEAFTAAVTHDAAYVEARYSLANALRRVGRTRESLPHYEDILRANPAVSQASFGHAMGLVRLGRYQEARARLEAGTRLFPDQPGFAHAFARLLASAPDDRVRDGARALTIMTDLTKAQQTLATAETMAMALAEVGRFDEAIAWQRDAIAAATQGRRDEPAGGTLAANLRLYQDRRPCRTPWADDDPVHRPR